MASTKAQDGYIGLFLFLALILIILSSLLLILLLIIILLRCMDGLSLVQA